MQNVIDSERQREKECYHEFCYYPLTTDVAFAYENTGHTYAIDGDRKCAYLTSPIADEDIN